MKTSITIAVSSALIGFSSAQCASGQLVTPDYINAFVPLEVCIAKPDGSNKAHIYSCDGDNNLLKQSFTTYNCEDGTNAGDFELSYELTNVQCNEGPLDLCEYYHVYEFHHPEDTACGTLATADLNGNVIYSRFLSANICMEYSHFGDFEQGTITSNYCDASIAVTGTAVSVTVYSDDQCTNAGQTLLYDLTDENTNSLSEDGNKCRYFAGCSSALTASTASDAGDDTGSYAGDDAASYAGDDAGSDTDVSISGHSTDGDDDGSDDGYDTGYYSSTCTLIRYSLIIALFMVFGYFIIG